MHEQIPLFYFSGTGNTQLAAEQVQAAFSRQDQACQLIAIRRPWPQVQDPLPPLFGLASPVYAWHTPGIVLDFIRQLPRGRGQAVFLIYTAGGGEDAMNINACRSAVRALRRQGYTPFYRRILLMSSNWMSCESDLLICRLAEILPIKADHCCAEILQHKERLQLPKPTAPLLFSLIGTMEDRYGARLFGRRLQASDACTRCGLCEKECPTSNIRLTPAGVHFAWQCQWCMKCLYVCPVQAIRPRFIRSCALTPPYRLMQSINAGKILAGDGKQAQANGLEKIRWYLDNPER